MLEIYSNEGRNIFMQYFCNLTDDSAFKYVFGNKEILIDFLNSYFETLKSETKVIKYEGIAERLIKPKYIKGKVCYGDLMGEINESIIVDLEMYTTFGKREFYKTKAYAYKLFTNQYEEIKEYKDAKKVLSINFIKGNFQKENEYAINRYLRKHSESNKEIFIRNENVYRRYFKSNWIKRKENNDVDVKMSYYGRTFFIKVI